MIRLTILCLALLMACSQLTKQTRDPRIRAEFQRTHPCPVNHERRGPCPCYVVDHIKPLCAGGDDSVDNMRWQEYVESLQKDKVERAICRQTKN